LTTGQDLRLIDPKSKHFAPIKEAQQRLAEAPLFIFDQPCPTINDIWELISKVNGEKDLGLIIVDDLASLEIAYNEDEKEVDPMLGLKHLAESLLLPVLAITPLAHPPDDQEMHYPSVSHLPPDQIKQADTVLLAYYPAEYGFSSPDGADLSHVLELIIAKNRYGDEWSVHLEYDCWTKDCRSLGSEAFSA
jgi:replicative DNA helicase